MCNISSKNIFLLHTLKVYIPHIPVDRIRAKSGRPVRLQVTLLLVLSVTSCAFWSTGSIFIFIWKHCNSFIIFIIWWMCKYCFDVRTSHVLCKGLIALTTQSHQRESCAVATMVLNLHLNNPHPVSQNQTTVLADRSFPTSRCLMLWPWKDGVNVNPNISTPPGGGR